MIQFKTVFSSLIMFYLEANIQENKSNFAATFNTDTER